MVPRNLTYLLPEEIESLFHVIKSPRDRAVFSLMLYWGVRARELGMLRLSDWNARDRFLFVRRGKNGTYTYSLRSRAARTLRAWIKIRGRAPGRLFGAGISRHHLDRLFREYCAAARIPPQKAHLQVLRTSCGVHLAAAGHGSWTILERMGYRSIVSTEAFRSFAAFPEEYDSLWNWGRLRRYTAESDAIGTGKPSPVGQAPGVRIRWGRGRWSRYPCRHS
jgi:integrase